MLYRHQIYDIIKDKMVVMGVFMIQTERLKIYAASNGEMKKFIEAQCVDALKEAYTEMMCGCIKHPEQRVWYAIWMIELKNGTHIGELCFKGLGADGMVEIGYGVSEEYEGKVMPQKQFLLWYAGQLISQELPVSKRRRKLKILRLREFLKNVALLPLDLLEKKDLVLSGIP